MSLMNAGEKSDEEEQKSWALCNSSSVWSQNI